MPANKRKVVTPSIKNVVSRFRGITKTVKQRKVGGNDVDSKKDRERKHGNPGANALGLRIKKEIVGLESRAADSMHATNRERKHGNADANKLGLRVKKEIVALGVNAGDKSYMRQRLKHDKKNTHIKRNIRRQSI